MSQKFLNQIKRFSTSDLTEFLRKNGYEEFEKVLISKGIDGNKFLKLNELQLLKFGLPPSKKKKLLAFLTHVKENPETYLGHVEAKEVVAPNKQTIRSENLFKEKLGQILAVPIGKKAPPAPKLEKSEPLLANKYVPMDQNDETKLIYANKSPEPSSEHYEPTTEVPNNSESDDEQSDAHFNFLFNLSKEPFFRNTDRIGARLLLQQFEDGAFLFRPSKRFFLSMTVKHKSNFFNFGIEKTKNNKIVVKTVEENMSPEFCSLSELVEYFTADFLRFPHRGEIIQCKLRPINLIPFY